MENKGNGEESWICKENHHKDFQDFYVEPKCLEPLNTNTGAQILVCEHKQSREVHAIKLISKGLLSKRGKSRLASEVACLKKMNFSKHVAKLFDIYETEEEIALAMEYVPGGTLFDRAWEQPERHLSEKATKSVMKQLLTFILEMKKVNIIHRDLKASNLCYSDIRFLIYFLRWIIL